MQAWEIIENKKLDIISTTENLNDVEFSKVKITNTLFDNDVMDVYTGKTKVNLPIVPTSYAVGIVTEFGGDDLYDFKKNSRVFISAYSNCGKCVNCISSNEEKCSNVNIAGYNINGYLKEFAVVSNNRIFNLPASVSDFEALFIDFIATCVSILDKLNIEKGQHVLIYSDNYKGIILSQLVEYYKGIPILICNKDKTKKIAENSGLFYVYEDSTDYEQELKKITGGRLLKSIVYFNDSTCNAFRINNICAYNAKIIITGLSQNNYNVILSSAVLKELEFHCIHDGINNESTAINLLANKVFNFDKLGFDKIKFNDLQKQLEKIDEDNFTPFIVNTIDL